MQTRSNRNLLSQVSDEQPWERTNSPSVAATGSFTASLSAIPDSSILIVGGATIELTSTGIIPASGIELQIAIGAYPAVAYNSLVEQFLNQVIPNPSVAVFHYDSYIREVDVTANGLTLDIVAAANGDAGNSIILDGSGQSGITASGVTLAGGEDSKTSLQPADTSTLVKFKTSIWRCIGRIFHLNISTEQEDDYWEESGNTIIPKNQP